jgi:serine/threonine protein kinase
VVSFLGRGGRAEVYAVREPLTHRFEALKILFPAYAEIPAERDQFAHEYVVTRNLEHPNILAPTELGETLQTLWLSFPVVAQHSASALIPKRGEVPDLGKFEILLRQAASALEGAHAHRVVHLDVKPANLLVVMSPDFTVYLSDFGCAEEIVDGAEHANRLASLPYAAPELLTARRGDYGPIGPATDQYALAASAMELLTGKPPFPKATTWAVAGAHLKSAPPSARQRASWLPPAVDSVLHKALAKAPGARYRSCGEFADVLLRVLQYRAVV